VSEVGVDGVVGDVETLGDFAIRRALSDQSDDGDLGVGEFGPFR
jgi:hypothetical protein